MTSARVAGLAYLVIIAMGMFAEFGVRANLVIAGDATRTATNIIGSESLFRFSIEILSNVVDEGRLSMT